MLGEALTMPNASSVLLANDEPTLTTEGFTWQEVITRVYGFRITATDRITSLKNLCIKDATPVDSLCSSGDEFLFLLLDDEIILRLEAFFTDDAIKAVRFFTSMRISQWFGETTGQIRRFVAPRGCAINSIQTRYGADGCTQLNVVHLPLTVIEDEYSVQARSRQHVHKSVIVTDVPKRLLPSARYSTYCEAPCAIVIKTGSCVLDIDVLSDAEHGRFVCAYRLWNSTPSEHVLTLTENEHIEAVGIAATGERITAICVKTNQQTSQWFGKAVPTDVTWFDCKHRVGSHICGFQLAGRSMTGVGVVYSVPSVDATLVAAKRIRRES